MSVNDTDVILDGNGDSAQDSATDSARKTAQPDTVTGSDMDAAESLAPAGEHHDDGLSRRDKEILAFERQWWKYAGAKEQAIRDLFDMSATRYYQVLNALIDSSEALAADPMLVKRLRRLRASRQRARSARRLGIDI
jgi:hypothetical protein